MSAGLCKRIGILMPDQGLRRVVHVAQRPKLKEQLKDCGTRSVSCNGFVATETNNPALKFGKFSTNDGWGNRGVERMTLSGSVAKTALLLLVAATSAGYIWYQLGMQLTAASSYTAVVAARQSLVQTTTISGIGSLVVAIATMFKPQWSPWSGPLYAALKGAVLGALSFQFEYMFPGLVQTAVLITFGTGAGLLAAYQSGLIIVSDRFRSIVTTAVIGIMIAYLGSMLLSLFGVQLATRGGLVGLLFSGFTAMVASSCLLLDFDAIRQMQYAGMPKWMEWYGGFTILVTLAWLYMEVLRFLSIFASSQRDS